MTQAQPLICPACEAPLQRVSVNSRFAAWACSLCHGVLLSTAALRGASERKYGAIWGASYREHFTSPRRCPVCTRAFRTFAGQGGDRPVQLEACRDCLVLWFDAEELEAFGLPADRQSPELARSRALLELSVLKENAAYFQTIRELRVMAYAYFSRFHRNWPF